MLAKKTIFILSFILLQAIAFGQGASQQYTNLIKKADHFYRSRNYKMATLTYSQAFKLNQWKASVDDRYNASCAWALAGIPDSAFYYLNSIVNNDNYVNYEQITTDHDLTSLQKDKRWKPLLSNIKQNIVKQESKLNKPLIKQLDTIFDEDQKYRLEIGEIEKKFGSDSKEIKAHWKIINEKDSINLIKINAIIDTQGWLGDDVIGKKGNSALFLVIQHADKKTQEKYLPLMRDAVINDNAKASDLALLEDKVALGQGKKQIYGSQIISDPKTGKYIIAPIEDEANVDKRREEVGLEPLENYVSQWGIVYKKKITLKKIDLGEPHNDIETAIEINDSIIGPLDVSKGHGSRLDFIYTTEIKEENSAWFKFTIPIDTVLIFDIVPTNSKDDYDFILFKCPNKDYINKIRTGVASPERWCFSYNAGKNASTGLSEYSKSVHVGAGYGDGYTSAIKVKAGETFYLMVNYSESHRRPSQGFTLYFYNYWPNKNPIILNNVLFETNKAILLKESFIELDKLVNQLKENKTMKIEVRGHTDNIGDEAKNQTLSENRAKAVTDYLIAKSIDSKRVFYKGFGSTNPIAPNDKEEGRKKNRRVEFSILIH